MRDVPDELYARQREQWKDLLRDELIEKIWVCAGAGIPPEKCAAIFDDEDLRIYHQHVAELDKIEAKGGMPIYGEYMWREEDP